LKINDLYMRLKIRQFDEVSRKQGKILTGQSFSPDLSTEFVDSFSLAPGRVRLQPGQGNRRPDRLARKRVREAEKGDARSDIRA
jgi:hypothetical protein